MPSPTTATSTLLEAWHPHAEACPFPTAGYCCEAWLFCFNLRKRAYTSLRLRALLSTGEPYSVVLPYLREDETFIIYEEEPAYQETYIWWGVPCRFVRVRMRLPIVGSLTPRPFLLRALLPLREVEDAPPLLHLGGNFLHNASARVELEADPWRGKLIIP